MTIVGIDPSLTATGRAVIQDGEVVHMGTLTTSTKGLHRLRFIADASASLEQSFKPQLTVIEGIAMMARGNITELSGLHWLIRDRIVPRPTLIVAPSQLKKFVLGKGNGEKSLMLREVYKRWGIEAANDNEADAVGLAKIGAAYLDPLLCENQAQREVIAALKAGPKKKGKKAA